MSVKVILFATILGFGSESNSNPPTIETTQTVYEAGFSNLPACRKTEMQLHSGNGTVTQRGNAKVSRVDNSNGKGYTETVTRCVDAD